MRGRAVIGEGLIDTRARLVTRRALPRKRESRDDERFASFAPAGRVPRLLGSYKRTFRRASAPSNPTPPLPSLVAQSAHHCSTVHTIYNTILLSTTRPSVRYRPMRARAMSAVRRFCPVVATMVSHDPAVRDSETSVRRPAA